MARRKAVVATFPELKSTVEEIVKKFPVAFEEIDPSRVLYLKSDSEHSKKIAKIAAIKVPHPSVTPFKFAITVTKAFDELDEARQVLHVMRELLRVTDFEESKLGSYPLQDFPEIIEKYGTLWEKNEALDSPLKEEKVNSSGNVQL